MKPVLLALLVGLFLLTSCHWQKAPTPKYELPVGWFYSPRNSQIEWTKLEESDPAFKMELVREANSPEEAHYITIAESIYPTDELIAKEIPSLVVRNKIIIPQKWYFERAWWYAFEKGKEIPFSITADTVKRYLLYYELFKDSVLKERQKSMEVGSNKNRVVYQYRARVVGETSSGNEVKVELTFSWYQYCGHQCGWGIEKTRTVVFSGYRKVLRIEGDGPTKKWVSTTKDPYGREWSTF